MAIQMYASIYIGSYEVSMKIFEFSGKKKIHEIDHVRRRLELGRDVYLTGSISYEKVDDLCDTLAQFRKIIEGYCVEEYEIYTSAGIGSAENQLFVIDQIHIRTGMKVKVISNSEHRFITYQSVAGREPFEKMIRTSAVVMDVGGAGIQLSLFREGGVVTTQFMDIGMVRLRAMRAEEYSLYHYEQQLTEYIDKELEVFCAHYLEGGVDYVILLNDYCMELAHKLDKNHREEEPFKADRFIGFIDRLLQKNIEEISAVLSLSNDRDPFIVPSMLLFRETLRRLGAGEVWVPGMDLNDGMACNYAQHSRILKPAHDFEADILSAARSIAEHYHENSAHVRQMELTCCRLFDAMKKLHGLGKRERLLLQAAAILHNVGRYVSIADYADCGCNIIMASEIIGISHAERKIIAYSVLFQAEDLEEYDDVADILSKEDFLVVSKLSAILRIANALDQSHKQKFKDLRISAKGHELVFTVETAEDISLERIVFEEKSRYFEQVFSVRPIIRQKRIYKG